MIGSETDSSNAKRTGEWARAQRTTNGRKLEKGTARTKMISLLGGLSTQKTQQGRPKKNKKELLRAPTNRANSPADPRGVDRGV